MATNKQTKKTTTKEAPGVEKTVETYPFAMTVEVAAVRKRGATKTAAPAAEAEAEVKPVKKTVKKAPKIIVADPFAEVAEVSSPVKKRLAKTVKAEAKAPKKVESQESKVESKKLSNLDSRLSTPDSRLSTPDSRLSTPFKALADVTLPELQRENRARLQMQTPTRLYLYWSIKENPWALLRGVFGDDLGSYTLVLKLIDIKSGREDIKECEAEGNWWFDVEPDHSYQAEVGFYAPNRPYFRILHSNTVETPRRGPSPRAATESDWTVSANKFAEVLDVAGFSRDAFDVAMAGDDLAAAENTSHTAFSSFLDTPELDLDGISAEDIRYAMLALASGLTLEYLRFKVSPALFAILHAHADSLDSAKAMSALTEHFDIDNAEFTEEQLGSAVYGASLVNFPRTLKTKTLSQRYAPVGSHTLASRT